MTRGDATPEAAEAVRGSDWYRLGTAEVAARLATDADRGLTAVEAAARLARDGPNALTERGTRGPLRLLADQFASTLVAVLVVAAAVAGIVGSAKDALAIGAILVLNALLGFAQEYRAERAMAALRRLAVPRVRVRRDGEELELPSVALVPGDLVLLDAGNLVPADGRIVDAASLRVQEAVLTGESEAVEKRSAAIPGEGPLPLGDQAGAAFMGTHVVHGRGRMLVTATGMATELGRVAELLQQVGQVRTPLQLRLDRLGRVLAAVAGIVVVLIFALGVLLGEDWRLMFMTAVSMAVAVIPEGLPAVVTIALASGARRMLARNALVRRLPAVETLGSVTVICSDKTGTLTENRMTVVVLDLAGHRLEVPEELVHRLPTGREGPAVEHPALALLLAGGALCNDATLQPDAARPGRFHALGDPTEGALVVAAARHGLLKDRLDAALPRVGEAPFDSDRKRMSTLHRVDDPGALPLPASVAAGGAVLFAKGAVDALLDVSTRLWDGHGAVPLDGPWRERIAAANDELARSGMRVLGVAWRPAAPEEAALGGGAGAERELVFLGLVGMIDPPRPEVGRAVARCREAGIRPVMITGDHPVTAARIARDLGILADGRVLSGRELQAHGPGALDAAVDGVSVFARVAPEQKLRIVEALQRRGQVVAMTGDGVNDAPALRRADIGVAMGITGTDVSKEASAMILLDDDFSTIVSAVEEGRVINDNIRRFLKFSLAGNLGKVLLVFVGPLLGLPLPLLPFQILWLNLVTDGLLGLGIGVEPAEEGTMRRPPRPPGEGILARGLGFQVTWLGGLIGLVTLAVAAWAHRSGQAGWQTLVMTTVVALQVVEAHAGRSATVPILRLDPRGNRALLGGTVLVVFLQALVIYLPPLGAIFGTEPLSAGQLAVPLLAAAFVLAVVDGAKVLGARRTPALRS